MVKKLFKHEFLSYLRIFLPIQLVVLGMALLVRILGFFENDSTAYSILLVASIVVFAITLEGGILGTFIIGIRRFYKNLFTAEGYLSLTLPVTQTQHILVKAVTAVTMQIAASLIFVVALCVATYGDLLTELILAAQYLINQVLQYINNVHLVFFIIELLLLSIIMTFSGYLLVYACVALGQTAKKHRVLLAFGIYYAYYVICQILFSVGQAVFLILVETNYAWLDIVAEFVVENPYLCGHIGLLSLLVIELAMSVVYFYITKHVLRKKLDLE